MNTHRHKLLLLHDIADAPVGRGGTKQRFLSGVVFALASLLLVPFAAKAQLPTPTYGWNLGNTLEPPSGEGTWGPAASEKLINAVADAGFNVIRLPVAWDSHANQSTYQIDAAWIGDDHCAASAKP